MAHRIYNDRPDEYLQSIDVPGHDGVSFDLAIIEFDDHGVFWKLDQLEDTLRLIARRNNESDRGILVTPYVHGWQNNADPNEKDGNLRRFKEQMAKNAVKFSGGGANIPDRMVGIYLGWRGKTSGVPVHKKATFWHRRNAADRVASLNMRETLFRIMNATRARPDSKCLIAGHSMGGQIVGKTLSPSLTTLLLAGGDDGVLMPADLVVLLNPALDALASWQFIDFLKRSNARLELRSKSGEVFEAPGPLILSVTSETDKATGNAYPFGRSVTSVFTTFRKDHGADEPSQRHLATHTEGHVDYLVSHTARVENGKVVLDRVANAYNDTPFWIVRVTSDISKDHSDTRNPVLGGLIREIGTMNRLYNTDVQTWMVTDRLSSTR